MFRLRDLPFELSEMIISEAISGVDKKLLERKKRAPTGLRALLESSSNGTLLESTSDEGKEGQLHSLASFACLGLQWQNAVEKVTFRSLKLHRDATGCPTSDLEDLARYVARGSPRCRYVEGLGLESSASHLLRGALQQLFDITASWHNPELKTRPVTLSLRYSYQRPDDISDGVWPNDLLHKDDRLYQLQLEDSAKIGKFAIQPHITSLRCNGASTAGLSHLRLAIRMPGLRSLDIELHIEQIFGEFPFSDVQGKTKGKWRRDPNRTEGHYTFKRQETDLIMRGRLLSTSKLCGTKP